jgi:hypothetical protein
LFYDNGGGICYIVSVGQYDKKLSVENFIKGIDALNTEDDVTLLLFPDAVNLEDGSLDPGASLGTVQTAALEHCRKTGDRFAILDVNKWNDKYDPKTDLDIFRDRISNDALKLRYGAAYYPFLTTIYTKPWTLWDVMHRLGGFPHLEDELDDTLADILKIEPDTLLSPDNKELIEKLVIIMIGTGKNAVFAIKDDEYKPKTNESKWTADMIAEELKKDKPSIDIIELKKMKQLLQDAKDAKEEDLRAKNKLRINSFITHVPGYDETIKELDAEATLLPPSGAIAGIYSATDQYQGVWKAPANISIASLNGVSDFITNQDQKEMNVDTNAGKSINAIRPFTGKGILVWGARTLDGNSKEWRYIPVRRLFNYIEESIQKSTSWAVFSSNDGNTWIKIKSQIENFLNNLWRAGALAGSTPEKSYYVNVGLGVTMTDDDIKDGLLMIEIGLAAVRPAEFIILKFSHKVQE